MIQCFTYVFLIFFMAPCFGLSGSNSIDSVLQSLLDYLTSTPARLVALISIVAIGYNTLFTGRFSKERAVSIVIGVGLIFGGASILQKLGLGS